MPINKALAEHLELYHKGEANAVTSRELECAFRMRGSELRREINALRGDGIPICSFDGGYYYAATEEELRRTIGSSAAGSRKSHLRSAACPAPCLTMRTPVSSPSRWREVTLLEQLYSLGRRQGQAAVDHQ